MQLPTSLVQFQFIIFLQIYAAEKQRNRFWNITFPKRTCFMHEFLFLTTIKKKTNLTQAFMLTKRHRVWFLWELYRYNDFRFNTLYQRIKQSSSYLFKFMLENNKEIVSPSSKLHLCWVVTCKFIKYRKFDARNLFFSQNNSSNMFVCYSPL